MLRLNQSKFSEMVKGHDRRDKFRSSHRSPGQCNSQSRSSNNRYTLPGLKDPGWLGQGYIENTRNLNGNFLDFHCFSGYKTNSYLQLGFLRTKLFVFGKITIQVPITIKVVKPGLKDPAGWNGGIKRVVGLGLISIYCDSYFLFILQISSDVHNY